MTTLSATRPSVSVGMALDEAHAVGVSESEGTCKERSLDRRGQHVFNYHHDEACAGVES